ncbi:MAG: cell division protein FtsA [Deltaproteobacteria bacterium]|nr:cell division protein FtsA [Deltaproteobacteria bacterium]
MAKREELIVGLDIGTTKICAVVGETTAEGIDVIGVGTSPSRGLRKGVVVNIDHTVNGIVKAIEEAELMAGCEITNVYSGIAGSHIRGINSRGMVAVKDKEVERYDIDRVIDAAKAIPLPTDREIIHILPQEYIIDEQDGIKEPLGMAGVRLEAKVHIVTGAVSAAQNLVTCANKAGLQVESIVLQPLASAVAVLSEDEKELGVALVDVGGGTADIAVFSDGSIVHTSVIPLGGNHITNDIAVGLRTPADEAEKIKIKYGCAMTSMVSKEENIEVPSVGGRQPRVLSRQILAEIIEPRVEEIFQLTHTEIQKSGYEELLASGVVITGGSTLMEGMPEMAEEVLGMPVRRGYPQGVGGLTDVVKSPAYSTGVGLVLHGLKRTDDMRWKRKNNGRFGAVFARIWDWIVANIV